LVLCPVEGVLQPSHVRNFNLVRLELVRTISCSKQRYIYGRTHQVSVPRRQPHGRQTCPRSTSESPRQVARLWLQQPRGSFSLPGRNPFRILHTSPIPQLHPPNQGLPCSSVYDQTADSASCPSNPV